MSKRLTVEEIYFITDNPYAISVILSCMRQATEHHTSPVTAEHWVCFEALPHSTPHMDMPQGPAGAKFRHRLNLATSWPGLCVWGRLLYYHSSQQVTIFFLMRSSQLWIFHQSSGGERSVSILVEVKSFSRWIYMSHGMVIFWELFSWHVMWLLFMCGLMSRL